MELLISPEIMKRAIATISDKPEPFITSRDEEMVKAIQIMESMNVRQIEVDLSEDSQELL